jgi:Domain of unknown function (DUF4124)
MTTMKLNLLMLSALLCIGAPSAAIAQQVYKCGSKGSVKYSDRPCSGAVVNTDDAPVPGKPNRKDVDVRRAEQNRALARAMRPRAGESAEQFETRRRRARLTPNDRAECERLAARMPVEQASMNNPDSAEVLKAESALQQSKKRFSQLRC